MRLKLLTIVSCTTLIILLTYSCKKNNQDLQTKINQNEQPRNVNKQLIKEAQDWFNKRSTNQDGMLVKSSHFGKFTPQWESSFTSQDVDFEIVECPVRFDYQPKFNMYEENQSSKSHSSVSLSKLIVLKNKRTDSIYGVFMNVVPSNDKVPDISYKAKNSTFTGYVFFSTLTGEFINGWEYENGKVTRASKITQKGKVRAPEEGGGGMECYTVITEWYTRDCTEYYNGNYTCGAWVYLETTFQTYCFVGSGGGGEGGGVAPVEPEIITFIDYDNPGITILDGVESEDPNTHVIKKQISYNWRLRTFEQKGPLGAKYIWHYYSLETGNLEKENQNANWKFTSLVHDAITVNGNTPPDYVVSHNLNQSLPSYGQNMLTAAMFINFTVNVVAAPPGAGPSYHKTIGKASDNWIAH